MYLYNIKRILSITLLLFFCRVSPTQAMIGDRNTLTAEAKATEIRDRQLFRDGRVKEHGAYISPEGLIYKKFTIKEETRVDHINRHCSEDPSNPEHSYFEPGTEACKDVVKVINKIFKQLKLKRLLDIEDRTRNLGFKKKIDLHGKSYLVVFNYDGCSQYIYSIIPDKQDSSYPLIGRQGPEGERYGYKLMLSKTGGNYYIRTFYPIASLSYKEITFQK
jgi:hypothetical protein